MENIELYASDFDETVGRTFCASPSGMCVEHACMMSVTSIFGEDGLSVYAHDLGGLKNRAPAELMASLYCRMGKRALDPARRYFDNNHSRLSGYVPQGKGVPLVWPNDHRNEAALLQVLTEMFVLQKLHYLMDEIGSIWPRPHDGFAEFWAEKSADPKATTAIISSGHEAFIKKVFCVWGLPQPDIFVTDDDTRGLLDPPDPMQRCKPAILPYTLAHKQWIDLTRKPLSAYHPCNVVYFGDDPMRDGGLAAAAGVLFGLRCSVPPAERPKGPYFTFSNWKDVNRQILLVRHFDTDHPDEVPAALLHKTPATAGIQLGAA